jgi:hypothetical protein
VLETFSACGRNCSAIDLTSLGCRQGQFERPFFQWSGSQRVSPRPSWPHCELKDQCGGWAKSSSDIFRDLSFQAGWQRFPTTHFKWFGFFLEIWRTWRRETENIFVFLVLVKCILSIYANSEDDFASIFLVNTIRLPTLKDSNLLKTTMPYTVLNKETFFLNNSVWELNKLTQNYQKSRSKIIKLYCFFTVLFPQL